MYISNVLLFSLFDGKYSNRSLRSTGEVATQATGHLQSVSYCGDVSQTLCEGPIIYFKVFHRYIYIYISVSADFQPSESPTKFLACSSHNSLLHLPTSATRSWRTSLFGLYLTFKRRIKSHLPFAGIIRSSPYSPRFQDNG